MPLDYDSVKLNLNGLLLYRCYKEHAETSYVVALPPVCSAGTRVQNL
jgi:hypothetical protein